MGRGLLLPIAMSTVFAAGLAAASAVGVGGGTGQHGSDDDLICDEDGVNVDFVLNGSGMVFRAVVSGVDVGPGTGCGGAFLTFDTDAAEGCPCHVAAIATGTQTFNFPTPVHPAAIGSTSVTIIGPDQEGP